VSRNSTTQKTLNDLFEHGLKDIYYAEKKIYKTLPKMIKASEDQGLKAALQNHREETAGQIERIENVFESLSKRPKAEKCEAMDGILEEGEGLLEDFGETPAGDAAIIFSCQAVEHYEISRYGSLIAYAEALGLDKAVEELEAILHQEKAADKKLTALATSRVNHAAEPDGAAAGQKARVSTASAKASARG
jgi:ferritin-like metal-binding protein YciE